MTRITDKAAEAAAKAVSVEWQHFVPSMRLALEAALPHLEGATPAPVEVAARERIAEVLIAAGDKWDDPIGDGEARQFADALLAAGVFREGATPAIDRETLEELFETHGVFETTFISTERVESSRRILAEAVLSLIGRAS